MWFFCSKNELSDKEDSDDLVMQEQEGSDSSSNESSYLSQAMGIVCSPVTAAYSALQSCYHSCAETVSSCTLPPWAKNLVGFVASLPDPIATLFLQAVVQEAEFQLLIYDTLDEEEYQHKMAFWYASLGIGAVFVIGQAIMMYKKTDSMVRGENQQREQQLQEVATTTSCWKTLEDIACISSLGYSAVLVLASYDQLSYKPNQTIGLNAYTVIRMSVLSWGTVSAVLNYYVRKGVLKDEHEVNEPNIERCNDLKAHGGLRSALVMFAFSEGGFYVATLYAFMRAEFSDISPVVLWPVLATASTWIAAGEYTRALPIFLNEYDMLPDGGYNLSTLQNRICDGTAIIKVILTAFSFRNQLPESFQNRHSISVYMIYAAIATVMLPSQWSVRRPPSKLLMFQPGVDECGNKGRSGSGVEFELVKFGSDDEGTTEESLDSYLGL